jgi:hypothetical protein
MPKTLKCDFHFNADGVAIRTTPGSARVLECHVPPARGRRCTVQIPSDSIAIDPQSEFDPRNLALLLQSSSKLTLLRPWPSMARLAQRCGCRVAILPRRGKLSEIPTESI